ncbi:MAG: sigma 54-interacting transcriptional regulator [Chitinispirillaceae bacterium]|nr:sigma 54-interacting transcriptional regulator [Chitinispirillaceae bacterium]
MLDSHNNKYDPILDSIADGVFTVDKDWNVRSFNRAAEQITGTRRTDAIGRKCWEVFHADVCERDCLLKKTLKTNHPCINKTVQIINKQGMKIPISISTAILRDEKGNVIGGVETFRDLSEIEELRKEVSRRVIFTDIITRDHRLLDLFNILPVIARSESPVLILGESGTGKELLAKAIHNHSGREKEPFIAVNCGALPENLLESELFGYKKGAFTDAKTDKPGRFDRARKGTLFLDEIGDLPKSMQVKLLRVLQEKCYEPLGATEPVKSEARIIAATNRNLEAMVQSGEFRQDLYYRINIIPITLPPLRDRQSDVPLLIDNFIEHFNRIQGRSIDHVSADAMSVLLDYNYPGNIRELENILQHAFVLCQAPVIQKKHLPAYLFVKAKQDVETPGIGSIEDFEKSRIEEALSRNRYSRAATAKELGMHVATLWRKMKRYNINTGKMS